MMLLRNHVTAHLIVIVTQVIMLLIQRHVPNAVEAIIVQVKVTWYHKWVVLDWQQVRLAQVQGQPLVVQRLLAAVIFLQTHLLQKVALGIHMIMRMIVIMQVKLWGKICDRLS